MSSSPFNIDGRNGTWRMVCNNRDVKNAERKNTCKSGMSTVLNSSPDASLDASPHRSPHRSQDKEPHRRAAKQHIREI